jgi:hypothetical protein
MDRGTGGRSSKARLGPNLDNRPVIGGCQQQKSVLYQGPYEGAEFPAHTTRSCFRR